jgi:arylsulfatase A-like enzyme
LLADVEIPEAPTLYDDARESNSNMKKEFMKRTKFHMLHTTSDKPGGANYYERHLNDEAPDEMWPHDANSDKDKIRVAYQHMMHKYIRCLTGNDDNLKRVLDYLDTEGLTEDTIVIYTSDQGYWLGQNGFYDKRLILETSIRMPFIIRYPKLIKPGTVNDDLCINVDIAPTLLELAGAVAPQTMQGQSMVPLLKEKFDVDWRKSQLYTYWGATKHYGIRTDRYTYVKLEGHPPELFDRRFDPDQMENVFDQVSYREVIKLLEVELQKQIKETDINYEELPGAKG